MRRQLRETGINALGAVPWGTHVCLFYDTEESLLETLVPYFKAGLENDEFCVWVLSESLNKQDCKRAMRKSVAGFARYERKGQIEIISQTELYLKDGVFDIQRVLDAWANKLRKAIENGYDGIRITGDTSWLGKKDMMKFSEYEAIVNDVIRGHNVLAICTYNINRYSSEEVLDISLHHKLTFFKGMSVLTLEQREKATSPDTEEISLPEVQKRFVTSGFKGFDDEGAIELVLSLCLGPEKAKTLAQACIEQFHTLRGFMAASRRELDVVGITPSCMFFMQLLRLLPSELLKQQLIDKPTYPSSREVFDYINYSMRDLDREIFKVIYLDNRNHIIDITDLFFGSVDRAPVHPRDIVESAIKARATCLIFVHNHPSGDPGPSRTDKLLTRDLVFMGLLTQIKVLDHIIVGANKYYSFADEGLIQKYEDDFLKLEIRLRMSLDKQSDNVTIKCSI